MVKVAITREEFLKDRQGRTFVDVLNDSNQPFDEALEFFNNVGSPATYGGIRDAS